MLSWNSSMMVRYVSVEIALEQILFLLREDEGLDMELGQTFIDVDASSVETDGVSIALQVSE